MGFLSKMRKRAESNNRLGLRKKKTSSGFLKRGSRKSGFQGVSGGSGFASAARRQRSGIGGLLSRVAKVANRGKQQPEVVEQTQSYFNPATGMASEAAEYTAPNPVMDYIKQAQARGESPSQQGIQNFIGGLYQPQEQMGPIQASTPQGGFPQANYGGPTPPQPTMTVQREQNPMQARMRSFQDRINGLRGVEGGEQGADGSIGRVSGMAFGDQGPQQRPPMGMGGFGMQRPPMGMGGFGMQRPPMGMGGFGMQRPPMGMGGFGTQRPPMGMGGFGMQRPQQQYGNAYAYGQPQRPPMGMGGFGMQRPPMGMGGFGMQRPPMGMGGFGMQRPPMGMGGFGMPRPELKYGNGRQFSPMDAMKKLPFGSFGGH